MDKLKKYFFITALFLFIVAMCCGLYACKTKQISSKSTSVTKDSTFTETKVIIKDSLVFTPVDSAAIKALVVCPDGSLINIAPIIKKSKHATASFEIKNGIAISKCLCDSQAIKVRTANIIKTEFKQRLNNVATELVKEKKKTPTWLITLSGIGGFMILLILLVIFKYLIKT